MSLQICRYCRHLARDSVKTWKCDNGTVNHNYFMMKRLKDAQDIEIPCSGYSRETGIDDDWCEGARKTC